jgi:flagellar motor switch protein FliM
LSVSVSDHILSQDEVDALLSAVDRGEIVQGPETQAAPSVVRYNFRKPNRISKDQVKMLFNIHESFGRLFSSSLTTLLRGLVEMELKNVEQATYGEFILSLPQPTCLVIFNMDPLKGGAAMEVSANVLFRLIDRLLGGSGLLPVRLREFTEVEQVLIERIAIRAMADLQQAWQHAGTFGFRVEHLETNPQFVQLTAPNEVVIVATFDIKLGEETGQMSLAFPHLLLEPIMPKLNSQRYFRTSQRTTSPEEDASLRENVVHMSLDVRGVLAEVQVPVRRLLGLSAGDVLPLNVRADTEAVIELQGIPRFTGRAGTLNRRRALRLSSVIPRGEIGRDPGDRAGGPHVHA